MLDFIDVFFLAYPGMVPATVLASPTLRRTGRHMHYEIHTMQESAEESVQDYRALGYTAYWIQLRANVFEVRFWN